jgi:uncharacterized protein (DUF1778 family)
MARRKLTTNLNIRLSPHEKRAIARAAARADKSASEWIRDTLMSAAEPMLVDPSSDAVAMWVTPEEGKEILRLIRRGLSRVESKRART